MCASLVVATGLPAPWGWENGPLENFQVLTLLLGGVVAVWAAMRQRGMPESTTWWAASLFWLALAARELSWGAVLLPPLGMNADTGPVFSSSVLWWKPAVKWVCSAMLLCCAYWVWRYRLVRGVLLRWWREEVMPWGCLLVFVLAMGLSAAAEGHAGQWMHNLPTPTRMVMEEMVECWAYLALFWAQWSLVRHMQSWHLSSRLRTMNF